MRPARADEIGALWKLARQAGIFDGEGEFRSWHSSAPWHVCVSGRGEFAVLERWREHLGIMAVRCLWCAPRRVPALAGELCLAAASEGFEAVLSPLYAEKDAGAWLDAGFSVTERIVTYRATRRDIGRGAARAGVTLRQGDARDLAAVAAIDEASFSPFWRYGPPELTRHAATERFAVAESAGQLIGYTLTTCTDGCAILGRLAVAPPARRNGIGSALLHESMEWAFARQAKTFSLCTQEDNEPSRRMYRSAGLRRGDESLVFMMRSTSGPGLAGQAGRGAEAGP